MAKKKIAEEVVGGVEAIQEFQDYMDSFKVFSERDSEIAQISLALMTREHVLLTGKPGTAKSEMSMRILNGISGAKIFRQQFTSFMDESYIFGPQIIEELKQGKVVHNILNSLADCEFAFLDEFFNANEETIVSTNEVLNERTFTRNYQQVKCPLLTAIMTTNQDRTDEKKLMPIYDRIMFTSNVIRVENDRIQMYKNALSGSLRPTGTYSVDKLKNLHTLLDSSAVVIPDGILELFDSLLKDYQDKAEYFISDRKAVKSLRVLDIMAMMRGAKEVEMEDLRALQYAWVPTNDAVKLATFDACYASIVESAQIFLQNKAKFNAIFEDVESLEADFSKAKKPAEFRQAVTVGKALLSSIDGMFSNRDTLPAPVVGKLTESRKQVQQIVAKAQESVPEIAKASIEDNDMEWLQDLTKGLKSGAAQKADRR
jgi:MoxR-like ATPase